MSESNDHEGKTMKNSDIEEEEKEKDEEKADDVSEEQNPSAVAATDTEVSDKLAVLSSKKENVDPPLKKQKPGHFTEKEKGKAKDVSEEQNSLVIAAADTESSDKLTGEEHVDFTKAQIDLNIPASETESECRQNELQQGRTGANNEADINAKFDKEIVDPPSKKQKPAHFTQKEIRKAKDVSEEQNPLVIAAADTEFSDKLTGEEHVDFTKSQIDLNIPASETESECRQNELQQGRTGANNEADINAKFDDENFLFEVQLSPSDYKRNELTIPRETAEKYFLAADTGTDLGINLLLFDKNNKQWPMMKLTIPQPGDLLVKITGWSQFFSAHNLLEMDLIQFYKPLQPLHNQHYLLDSLIYIFEKRIVAADMKKLTIPTGEARKHFPALNTSQVSSETLQISDPEYKILLLKFTGYPYTVTGKRNYTTCRYKLLWSSFVKKHKLEENDVICFYKSVLPLEGNSRYAIRFPITLRRSKLGFEIVWKGHTSIALN